MRRKQVIRLAVGLLVLLGASFSTARARQIWTVDQSRGQAHSAAQALAAAESFARAKGVPSMKLAPVDRARNRLDRARPPSANPLWGSQDASFFANQAAGYVRLRAQVRRVVTHVTAEIRANAFRALSHARIDLSRAASVDVRLAGPLVDLQRAEAQLQLARWPLEYRRVEIAAQLADSTIQSSAQGRELFVANLLRSVHESRDGVIRVADAQRQKVAHELSLLGLFTDRAATYSRNLDSLNAEVHSQSTSFAAAVKEFYIKDTVTGITADFARTVPAKFVLVSTENQSLDLYASGQSVYSTPVTTGGPELPTDHGVFHIYFKASPFVFHSPWPLDSPFYYPPTNVQFWMPFNGGEGLHDASWRTNFGPGSNVSPTDLGTGRTILGTHGCVNLPFDSAQFVWDWAPLGTTVVVI